MTATMTKPRRRDIIQALIRAGWPPHDAHQHADKIADALTTPPTDPCGEYRGYLRHRRRHEPACAACLQAKARYVAQQRAGTGETPRPPQSRP